MNVNDVRFVTRRMLLEEVKDSLPEKLGDVWLFGDITQYDEDSEDKPFDTPYCELNLELRDKQGRVRTFTVKVVTEEDEALLQKKTLRR